MSPKVTMVSNATPLIYLAKVHQLHLLRELFYEVLIPESVYVEVVVAGKEKGFADAKIVERAINEGWIKVLNVDTKTNFNEIEKGEAEAIELAKEKSSKLLVDDFSARVIALSLGVKPAGTLYVLYLAVKNGILEKKEAKRVLNLMIREGFRVSTELYSQFLEKLELI